MSHHQYPPSSHGFMPSGPNSYSSQAYGSYMAAYPYGQGGFYQQYPGMANMYGGHPGYGPSMHSMGRGRGGYYPSSMMRGGPFGRGGFRRGGRGGFRGYKKPFVGGTLETQREWERQTNCCFFLQGKCKFNDGCRFLHEENSTKPCQFGERCKIHGTKPERTGETPAPAAVEDALVKQPSAEVEGAPKKEADAE